MNTVYIIEIESKSAKQPGGIDTEGYDMNYYYIELASWQVGIYLLTGLVIVAYERLIRHKRKLEIKTMLFFVAFWPAVLLVYISEMLEGKEL